jgi:hypothetical protein
MRRTKPIRATHVPVHDATDGSKVQKLHRIAAKGEKISA